MKCRVPVLLVFVRVVVLLISRFQQTFAQTTLEAPAIIIYPNSAIVTNGYSVVVACVVDGTPSPNITWSMTAQNGSVATLQMSTTISIRQNTTTYGNDIYTVSYLTYCSFWANNSGNYTCSGSNGVNGTSLTVTSAGFVLDVDECAQNLDTCSQLCYDTSYSYTCSCYTGYTLSTDGITCIDINECSMANGGCSQFCVNTNGSFYCQCNTGYQLSADNKTCNG